MQEEIKRVETQYDVLKFSNKCEKVDGELLIDRLNKEVLFLLADSDKYILQDEHIIRKEQIKKEHNLSAWKDIDKCENNEENMSHHNYNKLDKFKDNDANMNHQNNDGINKHKENDNKLN